MNDVVVNIVPYLRHKTDVNRTMGQQKYKIYVNGVPVFLTTPAVYVEMGVFPDKLNYVGHYQGKKKQIKQFLDLLDKNRDVKSVTIISPDVDALWTDFQACFKILEAAGGYVLNENDLLLVFFRRGSWDIPKGKIDPGETPEETAVREVMEETGLNMLNISDKIGETYHAYFEDEAVLLKETHWYKMNSSGKGKLKPQEEEGISEVKWADLEWFKSAEFDTYHSVKDIIGKLLAHETAAAEE